MVKELKFKNLRNLKVLLLHPYDSDGKEIFDQISRIGCKCEHFWPPSIVEALQSDVVIVGIYQDKQKSLQSLLSGVSEDAAVIAVINYESPSELVMALNLNTTAVISKPVRSFGILANLVISYSTWEKNKALENRIKRLKKVLAQKTVVSKAVLILMKSQSLSEESAYKLIRSQAMSKRTTIINIAESILNTENLLTRQ